MNPNHVFLAINTPPLLVWTVWVLAPQSPLARRIASGFAVWVVMASLYVLLVGLAVATGEFNIEGFFTLPGLKKLLSSDWPVLASWCHFLCFDLFVGRFILNDAPQGGYRLSPFLFLTYMFGPAGLLGYLIFRGWAQGNGSTSGSSGAHPGPGGMR